MEPQPPRGPLAVRWGEPRLGHVRAGALGELEVEIENAGTATWRSRGGDGIHAAYHWLDERGNPIVWDGIRTPFAGPVEPGGTATVRMIVRGPLPPGRYTLALDLVDERRFWFERVGNARRELEVEVRPRIGRRLAARGGDPAALAAQEEPLVPEDEAEAIAYLADGVAPAPDWSRRVLDAHQEGFAVVGGSVAVRRSLVRGRPRELAPWAPGPGRVPGFPYPLLVPSIVRGYGPEWLEPIAGLPAAAAPHDDPRLGPEPSLYDGRIAVTAPTRRGRRHG